MHESRGAHTAALELLRSTWDGFRTLRYFVSWVSLGPDLVRFALRLDDRVLADAVARDVAVGAAGSSSPSASGAALRCRGLINRDPGLMLEAVDMYARRPGECSRLPRVRRHGIVARRWRRRRPTDRGAHDLRRGPRNR